MKCQEDRRKSPYSEQGLSIIGFMVAFGIVGLLASISSSLLSTNVKTIKKITEIREREDIGNLIREHLDCGETQANGYTYLYDLEGIPLMTISGGNMVFGSWTITINSHNSISGDFSITAQKKGFSSTELFNPPLNCP